MEIKIKATAKEIADLVSLLQSQQNNSKCDAKKISDMIYSSISSTFDKTE